MRMSARGALVAVIAARCVDTGIARLLVAFVGLMAAIGRAMLARAAGSAAPRRGMAFIADIAACGHRDHPFHVVRGAVLHHATYDTAVQSGGWLWPANWAFAANAGQSRVATTAARRGWPGRAADWRGLLQGRRDPAPRPRLLQRRRALPRAAPDVVCPQRHAPPGGAGLRPVPSAGAGASNAPTHGCRTSGNSATALPAAPRHRRAQFALAIACIPTAQLINRRNRWNPSP